MSTCHEHGETRVRWLPRPDGLEESVQFTPGYNCPVEGWNGHGVHGMEISWFLRGPDGAVRLRMGTDWIPGELHPGHGLSPDGMRSSPMYRGGWSTDPRGCGLSWHSRVPLYEGATGEQCCYIDGQCYFDETPSGADPAVAEFIQRGEQAIFDALEEAYQRMTAEGAADAEYRRSL